MNAKEEFLKEVDDKEILCAFIEFGISWDEPNAVFKLPIHYTNEQAQQFLNSLDFDYDTGYGSQELFGYIWYEDGTWSERVEYDGSEWWRHVKRPEIPKELLDNK